MRAIKKAKRIIEKDPALPLAKFLTSLILSLETNNEFPMRQLYELPLDDFDFALEILKEWRIDRHYMGKVSPVAFTTWEDMRRRFEAEWRQIAMDYANSK